MQSDLSGTEKANSNFEVSFPEKKLIWPHKLHQSINILNTKNIYWIGHTEQVELCTYLLTSGGELSLSQVPIPLTYIKTQGTKA